MKTITKRRVASEYMQRDVVTVSPDNSLREALDLMTENHVTGLPVMDDHSRCVGLITSSDILNYEQEHSGESADGATADFFDPESQQDTDHGSAEVRNEVDGEVSALQEGDDIV